MDPMWTKNRLKVNPKWTLNVPKMQVKSTESQPIIEQKNEMNSEMLCCEIDSPYFPFLQLSCHENSVALQRDNWLGQDGH